MGTAMHQARPAMGFQTGERARDLADRHVAFARGCRQRAEFGDADEQRNVVEPQLHGWSLAGSPESANRVAGIAVSANRSIAYRHFEPRTRDVHEFNGDSSC